jgi:hypothetical protein
MVEHLLVIDIIACNFFTYCSIQTIQIITCQSEMAGSACSIPGKFFKFIITLLSSKSFPPSANGSHSFAILLLTPSYTWLKMT